MLSKGVLASELYHRLNSTYSTFPVTDPKSVIFGSKRIDETLIYQRLHSILYKIFYIKKKGESFSPLEKYVNLKSQSYVSMKPE